MLMNYKTKYYMFDTIPRDSIKPLASRIGQGIFNQFCNYLTIKIFPLVFVSLVTNIAPLLVAVFSYILYKIALKQIDIINLIVSFIGVTLLITGSAQDPNSDPSTTASLSFTELIIPSILLLCIPINQCSI